MFAPMRQQYRDGRPNDPMNMRQVGETPKLPMLTDMRARPPIGSVTPARSLGGGPSPAHLANIRAENAAYQAKIASGELVRDPGQIDRGPPRYVTRDEAINFRAKTGPQFGQLQGGSGPTPPSLQEVLAGRGFDAPAMQTGMQDQMMRMFKDPVTGENRSGGAHSAKHADAMSKFYGQNPEALEIAKQYNTDPTQFGGKPLPIQTLGRQLKQEMPQPQPVQEFQPTQRPSFQSLQQPMGQQQPQFNQQGMQQMMQFMQQMMQMFSMMSGQGGRGGFGGGFNQRPPMLGGGFGGGMGGGFGGGFMNQRPYGGGFGQGGYQQPRQRPMPSYPRMQNNYSQDPFGGY